tara:strand:- start:1057 stop:1680 length:624 start_codon:yes stop_codon:yes gene_type:complete
MRQHVNPLSNYYDEIIPIPLLREVFKNPDLPLHLDLGTGSGDFLFKLAFQNQNWNYMGIEIREKLVLNAKLKYSNLENLFFAYGNANNLIKDLINNLNKINFQSISVNFPDPWFKKKHHKRRIIQDEFVNDLSQLMPNGSFIVVKSDVYQLFKYIDLTILGSSHFKKIDKKNIDFNSYFNPNRLQTDREIYSFLNKLTVFEQIYVRN